MCTLAMNLKWASVVSSAGGALIAMSLVVGCGDSDGSGGGAGTGAAGGSGGVGGASPPVIDPSLFDCSAAAPPERVSSVPVSCAVDRACATPLVTGHRGVGGDIGIIAPENTLAAVRAAIALGVDFVETDPRETQDGVLVNVHDTDVDRTTDGTGEVDAMTLAELQTLSIDASAYPGDFSCEHIPTIEQVLAEAKGKIHVLLDANKTDRVDLLVEAVLATDTLEWAIFDTSSTAKIEEALTLAPTMLTMIRVENEAELTAALTQFADHPPIIVELSGSLDLAQAVLLAGHRPFVDVFGTDIAASFDLDPQLYAPVFDAGIVIAQTDRPDLVLTYLGRFGD